MYDCVFPYKEEIHFIVSKGTSCSRVPMFKVTRQNNLWLSWRGWGWQWWWNPTIKGELEAWDILKKQNYYGNCEQILNLVLERTMMKCWLGGIYIGVLHPLHLDIQQWISWHSFFNRIICWLILINWIIDDNNENFGYESS